MLEKVYSKIDFYMIHDELMDVQVSETVKACNFHLRSLRHVRKCLTLDSAKTIACGLVAAKLDYCNSLLSGTSKGNLMRCYNVSRTTWHVSFYRENGDRPRRQCWRNCTGFPLSSALTIRSLWSLSKHCRVIDRLISVNWSVNTSRLARFVQSIRSYCSLRSGELPQPCVLSATLLPPLGKDSLCSFGNQLLQKLTKNCSKLNFFVLHLTDCPSYFFGASESLSGEKWYIYLHI